MEVSATKQIVRFFRFMRLFRVSFFSLLEVEPHRIRAVVAWPDDCVGGIPDTEDMQEVVWHCLEAASDDALEVGEYACDEGLIASDRIRVDVDEIRRQFGWNPARSRDALDMLLQMRVSMIDDGKETDEFLLHK